MSALDDLERLHAEATEGEWLPTLNGDAIYVASACRRGTG